MRWITFILVCATAAAQTDLRELVAEALANNPEVRAAQKRYEAARQRPAVASSLPDPMFSPSYAANGRPWPGALLGVEPTSNIGFMVSQELPGPGKRRLAGAIAEKEADAGWQEYQAVQLGVVAKVKQAYYRRAFAYSAVGVVDKNIAVLNKLRKLAEIRYAAGKAMQQDVLKVQTQISILETRRLQFDREKAAREAELVTLMGRKLGATVGAPSLLAPAAVETSLDQLYAAAKENSPLLRAGEKKIQRAELAVNLARKDVLPDYTVRAGYFNMGRMPDMYQFGVDIRLPLWFARKQRAMVTEKAQELVESQRNLEAEGQQLAFRIKDDFLAAQTAAQLVKLYAETVIPQASVTLESSLASYETGAVDFLAVFMNYLTVVEYEMNYYEELQNQYLALARLEEMTAKELVR